MSRHGNEFKRVARMPGAMAVGIGAQFVVLPAVTFALTLLLRPQGLLGPKRAA